MKNYLANMIWNYFSNNDIEVDDSDVSVITDDVLTNQDFNTELDNLMFDYINANETVKELRRSGGSEK